MTQFMCLKDYCTLYAEHKLQGGKNRNREAFVCSLLKLKKAWTIVVTVEVMRNGLYQPQQVVYCHNKRAPHVSVAQINTGLFRAEYQWLHGLPMALVHVIFALRPWLTKQLPSGTVAVVREAWANANHRTAPEFSKAQMKNPATGRSISGKEGRIVVEQPHNRPHAEIRFCFEGRGNTFAVDWI